MGLLLQSKTKIELLCFKKPLNRSIVHEETDADCIKYLGGGAGFLRRKISSPRETRFCNL